MCFCVQISTILQSAVAIVHAFPCTVDLIAIVDTLAEEEGEPFVEAFEAAVGCYGSIYKVPTLMRFIVLGQTLQLVL